MAGMAEIGTQFLENRLDLVKMDVAWQGMAEKAVKNFAMLVIHNYLRVGNR
jgi:hypothetical protein